ncbi:phosphodiester glycosidase family protein [Calothrix rhizosoleniae]|uniref:phosphodiester glycosidase family protein n=1 Tax=Calothrix rhizosoleniae TaxID=888997 RepID=UPI000B499486|nr:phosphodiester glycosidase family protein [Calothrix rhizosoleniae]
MVRDCNFSLKLTQTSISSILCFVLGLTPTNVVNAQQSIKPPVKPGVFLSGQQIFLNGRMLTGAWLQQKSKAVGVKTYLSDAIVMGALGVDFRNNFNPQRQPIQWFSSTTKPQSLASLLIGGYRYLDMTNFAKTAGWKIKTQGNTLFISTPTAKVTAINQLPNPTFQTITIDLNRPTPWQLRQELPVKRKPAQTSSSSPDDIILKPTTPPNRDWTITLDSIADPVLVQRYAPAPEPLSLPNFLKQLTPELPSPQPPQPEPLIKAVKVVKNQTFVTLSVPFGFAPRVITANNPHKLQVEIRPDALLTKNITWAKGIRWRQQWVTLGTERFPIVSIELDPRTSGLQLRPFIAQPDTVVGTAPLIRSARQNVALTAINGGFFNRNNRLPLGAIRRDGQWLSSPILNRGAIAWNDSGQFYYGRLALKETLITSNRQRLPILYLNSGFVQSGISRYTPAWGQAYTPLSNNEIILTVQKNQITNQLPGGNAGEIPVPIPADGYLLILRGSAVSNTNQLPIGTNIRIDSDTTPGEFNRYPHILGAGPLLLQNRQIVLDGASEKFNSSFIKAKAIRSAICTTSTGNLMIAAVHHRAGGAGPTLAEHAQLMQRMGCINALNLDGGSSTSLYLGGQLLNRSPNTAARVHNGIGIFLQPRLEKTK